MPARALMLIPALMLISQPSRCTAHEGHRARAASIIATAVEFSRYIKPRRRLRSPPRTLHFSNAHDAAARYRGALFQPLPAAVHSQSIDGMLPFNHLRQLEMEAQHLDCYGPGALDRALCSHRGAANNKVRLAESWAALLYVLLNHICSRSTLKWPVLYGAIDLPLLVVEVIGPSAVRLIEQA